MSGKMERQRQGGAAAVFGANIDEVRALAGKAAGPIAKLVGDSIAERFLRAAVAHYMHAEKPERMHNVEPRAYMAAVMDAAMDKLLPDGRDGWIVPRGTSCSWHPSWRGLVKLARRATTLRDLSAEIVYAADDWRLTLGSNRAIEHTPFYALGIPYDRRGEIVGAYAGVRIAPSWSYEFRFVDEHRLRQVAAMSGDPRNETPSDVWIRHPEAMRRKHAIRMLLDWIEAPDDVLDVLAREDNRERARVSQIDADAPTNGANREPASLAEQIRESAGDEGAP